MTIKGINGAGVPRGTKCAKKFNVLFIREKIIKPNQNGRANERVIAKCLVDVKEYASSPKILVWEIKKNKEINNKILILLFFKRTENSEIKAKEINLNIIWKGDLRAQNCGKMRNNAKDRLNQFNGVGKEDAGSKIEKRLFIIFNLNF